MCQRFEYVIYNNFASLAEVGETIRLDGERMQLDQRSAYVLDLVVEEMVSNVIKYGYNPRELQKIKLVVSYETERVAVEICDSAAPFDPLAVPPPAGGDLDSRLIGGEGIALVRKMTGSMHYRRGNGENIVTVFIIRKNSQKH